MKPQEFDSIICGGGITALIYVNLFVQLPSNKDKKILLLEKKQEFGGRLQSLEIDNKFLEFGPSRFNQNHTLLKQLLNELDIGYQEYTSNPIFTFSQPFHGHLLTRSPESRKKQIMESKYSLTELEWKMVERYEYHPWRLIEAILETKKNDYIEGESLSKFFERHVGEHVTKILMDGTGFDTVWNVSMPEAIHVALDMYSFKNHWFSAKEPLCNISKKLVYKFIKHFSNQVELRINSEVKKIVRTQENDYLVQTQKEIFRSKNLILAVDLPSLKVLFDEKVSNLAISIPFKESPLKALSQLETWSLLRLFAKFPVESKTKECWYNQKEFPVIYSGTKLRLTIPSSVPGWMQISYTDSKSAEYWKDLLNKSDAKEVQPGIFKVISTHESPIVKELMKELQYLLPTAKIPFPDYVLAHPCHVMYPTSNQKSELSMYGMASNFRPDSKFGFVVIGEAVASFDDLGVTSSWLESGIRSAVKGFNHINSKSNIKILSLK